MTCHGGMVLKTLERVLGRMLRRPLVFSFSYQDPGAYDDYYILLQSLPLLLLLVLILLLLS